MLNFLKRDKVQDPFGSDDGFEVESRFAGKGPKIALAASGVMALILAGGVAAIVLTNKAPPPPMMGSLSDVEVVEDSPGPNAGIVAAQAPTTPSAPAAKAAPAAPAAKDAVASTDRSTDRRPWLNTPPPPAERLGVKEASKPAPPATPDKQVAEAKGPLMTPPPAKSATPPAAAPAPPAPVPSKASEPVPAQTAAKAEPPPADKAEKDKQVAEALPFGPAPGAPSLFDLPKGADTGPAVAGGKPRLADPVNPPTDKAAIDAPPPRFANLAAIKLDPSKVTPSSAKVAIVVEDLGLSQLATETAIAKLPPAVTLAFSPYARDLKKWLDKAKAGGHEVLIEVPMESKEFPAEDPGPLGLLTTAEPKENQEHLDAILKSAGPAIGVLDAEGSKFRESDTHIAAVFAALKEKKMFYVQAQPGVRVGEATVPVAVADVVLDERPFRAAVDARLDYAERLAKYQGSAVAALSAKPIGFERLVLWIEQAQKKGIALTPISQVTTAAAANAPEPAPVAPKAGTAPAAAPKAGAAPATAPAKAPAKAKS